MATFDESEEMRVERAKAAFNLIYAYGKVGDLASARAIFDAMAAFGDSEEVRIRCAKAASHLIFAHARADKPAEVLSLIERSANAQYLAPLIAGLKLYLGEKVMVAREIYEMAKDVKKFIEESKHS
jgi:hypothetical protein